MQSRVIDARSKEDFRVIQEHQWNTGGRKQSELNNACMKAETFFHRTR
jgi:hypothetical protein